MDINTPVPECWQGAWQRLDASGKSIAFWLQTRHLYAYLSVPAKRPDSTGKPALSDYDFDPLMELAAQDGAAGACIVDGEVLHRRRQLDYSPTRGKPFLRRMQREGNLLREESLRGTDKLTWQKISPDAAEIIAFRFLDEAVNEDFADPCKGMLLVAGDSFMFVRDRGTYAMQAESLQVLAECKDYGAEELIPLLEFEISYGLRAGGAMPWEIRLSTLPFREGKPLLSSGEFEAIAANWQRLPQKIRRNGELFMRRWSLDEWTRL